MGKKALIACAALFVLMAHASSSSSFEGPLAVKNQFPLFLHVNAPRLESAAVETSFSSGISYSSVYMVRNSATWSVGIDAELAELSLRYRKAFGPLEVGVEVPVLLFTSGVMDGFLSSYHKTFGFSDYGRSGRPANRFLYEVRRNGRTVIKGTTEDPEIGDIRFSTKYALRQADPVISIRADVELPTGDAKKGFGSGSLDAGAALLIDKKLGDKFKAHLNLGAVLPGDLKAYETVHLRDFLFAGAGIEAALWKNFSLLGQVMAQGSPFPRTDIGAIDRPSVLLVLGGRYVEGKDSIELSITEDPNTAGAPDVTFGLFYKRRF